MLGGSSYQTYSIRFSNVVIFSCYREIQLMAEVYLAVKHSSLIIGCRNLLLWASTVPDVLHSGQADRLKPNEFLPCSEYMPFDRMGNNDVGVK